MKFTVQKSVSALGLSFCVVRLSGLTVQRSNSAVKKRQVAANLKLETKQRLEFLGQERALIYKTLVLTGLRKGELASLTVGHLQF